MQFKKKLKTRLYVAIAFIIFGIVLIATSFITKTENHFISSFGFAMVIMGIARMRNYFIITKTEDSIRRQEVAENDERNIYIQQKAKSATFSTYLLLSCTTVTVLSFLGIREASIWISYSVLLLIAIYWIFYFVYQKKS